MELTASTTNLALVMPEEFGERIAELEADQKAAILAVIGENFAYLRKHHATNKTFMDYLDKQYGIFAASAHVA